MDERITLEKLKGRLARRTPHLRTLREFRQGAVIVPLVQEAGQLALLFELRSTSLSRHAGLVSFPGGRIDDGEDPRHAALRELGEEIGIREEQTELLGEMDIVEGLGGDRIHPFFCRILPGYRPVLQAAEVQEVFTVPLEYLLAHGFQHSRMVREVHPSPDFPVHLLPEGSLPGRSVHLVPYLPYGRYLIWGLTARITEQVLELLAE